MEIVVAALAATLNAPFLYFFEYQGSILSLSCISKFVFCCLFSLVPYNAKKCIASQREEAQLNK